MGFLRGSDVRSRPRVLAGIGSRCSGGPGPKPPRGRHAGCASSPRTLGKAEQKLGKLVNQGRHAAYTASLDQLPETARPPGQGDPLGGCETNDFAKARYRSLQGAGATACLRARPTDSLRVIPPAEFVGMGRRSIGIEEHVAVTRPCCDAVDVGTRIRTHLSRSLGAGR